MSWSVLGIFVLLVTWGFTKSILFGVLLLVVSIALYAGVSFFKHYTKQMDASAGNALPERQDFLANELNRLENLRELGLLTEDELTVQNRLLSCNKRNASIPS